MLPNPIKNFVAVFSKLPSIGPRQATRLAFYIAGLGKARIQEISEVIAGLASLTFCERCFRTFTPSTARYLGQSGSASSPQAGRLCSICADPTRSKSLIAIVEKETDIFSLEKTRKFNGWYLLMGELQKSGELEPEQKARLSGLKNFIKKEIGGPADEIILAINPTVYGDLNASLLKTELAGMADKITRLGRGIPTGGEIEFADEDTLGQALERRN